MNKKLLDVQGVGIQLGGLTILDDVSFSVDEGQVVGVIGPNGAGKTTLFNIVSGFMRPNSGVVTFDGQKLNGLKPEQICSLGLSRTFQKVRGLPQLSVRENVLVGALNRHKSIGDADEVVAKTLQRLGLDDFAAAPAASLPIGLRKKLEVARALATEPKLILLDEVMGGLVPTEIREIMSLIRELADDGMTVILIEHHMAAIMGVSDYVYVIESGKNLAEGTPQEVTSDKRVLAAYLGEEYGNA